eukprot:GGOE01001981.1.p2 GENE.GGOE01001981.1~~GGOE01001981.1.p2  ORF type:complete len:228 (-),score=51.27 GGOE01001981.1:371-1054(-)
MALVPIVGSGIDDRIPLGYGYSPYASVYSPWSLLPSPSVGVAQYSLTRAMYPGGPVLPYPSLVGSPSFHMPTPHFPSSAYPATTMPPAITSFIPSLSFAGPITFGRIPLPPSTLPATYSTWQSSSAYPGFGFSTAPIAPHPSSVPLSPFATTYLPPPTLVSYSVSPPAPAPRPAPFPPAAITTLPSNYLGSFVRTYYSSVLLKPDAPTPGALNANYGTQIGHSSTMD